MSSTALPTIPSIASKNSCHGKCLSILKVKPRQADTSDRVHNSRSWTQSTRLSNSRRNQYGLSRLSRTLTNQITSWKKQLIAEAAEIFSEDVSVNGKKKKRKGRVCTNRSESCRWNCYADLGIALFRMRNRQHS